MSPLRSEADRWAREELRARGAWPAVAAGRCMEPLLPSDRRVELQPRLPEVGEVAVYEAEGGARIHRVVGRGRGVFLVRGDRPGAPLERVAEEAVWGTWAARSVRDLTLEPHVGRLIGRLGLFLSRPELLPPLRRAWAVLATFWPAGGPPTLEVLGAVGEAEVAGLSRLGLWRDAGTEAFAARFLAGQGRAVVARSVGRLQGAVLLEPFEDGLRLHVAVAPAARGRGLGGQLLAAALPLAPGVPLYADVARDNPASLALFGRAGFRRVAAAVAVSPRTGVAQDRYATGRAGDSGL